jgi:GT2 family glycosyltransferase
MAGDLPGVSVVVLSHNRPGPLAQALASLRAQTLPPEEVIVVDNRSPASDEIARLLEGFPGYTLIRHGENRGFAAGMNSGISRATQPYVYLTEDDVVLAPDCLERLLGHAARQAHPGLLSGLMVDAGTDRILSAGGAVQLAGVYRLSLTGRGEAAPGRFDVPFDTEYVPGAMVLAPRDVWRTLGGFREDFFVYGEDTDLCLRARRAGYRITLVPAARVRHLPAGDAAPSALVEYHKLKNFFALYLLHARPSVWPQFVLRYVLLGAFRQPGRVFARALGWNVRNLGRLLRDRGRPRPSSATVS